MRVLFVAFATAFGTGGIPQWKCWGDDIDELNWKLNKQATLFANELLNARPEPLDAGLEKITITTPLPNYPIPNDEKHLTLLTRTVTRELYDEVLRQMGVPLPARVAASSTSGPPLPHAPTNQVLETRRVRKAVVEGNPGIGKSMGLFHPLRHLLRLNQFVVFHYSKLKCLYAFVPASMTASVSSPPPDGMSEPAASSNASGLASQSASQMYEVYILTSLAPTIPTTSCHS